MSTVLKSELWTHLGVHTFKRALALGQYRKIARTCLAVAVVIVYFVCYQVFRLLSSPFSMLVPRTREMYDSYFAAGFWTLCCYILEVNELKIALVGDQLESENALFISNHCSLVDYIIFSFLVTEVGNTGGKKIHMQPIYAKDQTSIMLPRLCFFTWFQLWNLPGFSFWKNISQTDENWELDGETLASTFSPFVDDLKGVEWVVTFPEVNILTEKNQKMQKIMSERYYLPDLTNVLYPRFSGFSNAIGGLYGTPFSRLYEVALVYIRRKDGKVSFKPPNLLEAFGLCDEEICVVVHIHGKLISRVPKRRDRLEKWLERRWVKKDTLISKLKLQATQMDV